jgi:hypothetical protein
MGDGTNNCLTSLSPSDSKYLQSLIYCTSHNGDTKSNFAMPFTKLKKASVSPHLRGLASIIGESFNIASLSLISTKTVSLASEEDFCQSFDHHDGEVALRVFIFNIFNTSSRSLQLGKPIHV